MVPLLSTGYQAVTAWNVWHKGICLSEDWQASGLAILDDTETFVITGAFLALASEMDINNMDEIHVFTDSTTAIRQSFFFFFFIKSTTYIPPYLSTCAV